jgi:4-hydroxy-2-oxoheptanedioate aldolase
MAWIRQRVLRGETLSGAWLSLGSAVAAEMAGAAGLDWLLFDLEHGTAEYSDLLHQLQAVAPFPVASIVRVPQIDAAGFKRVLDLGPDGIMVPNIRDAAEATECLRLARVPPLGVRGAAQTTRASGYGSGYDKYLADVNRSLTVVAQIESSQGVQNADAIAAVDGIDVLFVGPTDLSVDLKTEANGTRGPFRDAILQVVNAARGHGKAAGVLVRNIEQAAEYLELGFSFVALGSDRGLIATGMRRNAEALAALASTRRPAEAAQ